MGSSVSRRVRAESRRIAPSRCVWIVAALVTATAASALSSSAATPSGVAASTLRGTSAAATVHSSSVSAATAPETAVSTAGNETTVTGVAATESASRSTVAPAAANPRHRHGVAFVGGLIGATLGLLVLGVTGVHVCGVLYRRAQRRHLHERCQRLRAAAEASAEASVAARVSLQTEATPGTSDGRVGGDSAGPWWARRWWQREDWTADDSDDDTVSLASLATVVTCAADSVLGDRLQGAPAVSETRLFSRPASPLPQ